MGLGIIATGTTPVHTPSTGVVPKVCNQFDISIVLLLPPPLNAHVWDWTLPVIECHLSPLGYLGLIGRDILNRGVLVYDGARSAATLAF